jgi:hypothetical protein
MYTPAVGRNSNPARLRGIEEWIPEQLKQYLPTDPTHIFIYAGVGIVLLSIVFGGGISGGGKYRGKR